MAQDSVGAFLVDLAGGNQPLDGGMDQWPQADAFLQMLGTL